jgi:hypothetical protein
MLSMLGSRGVLAKLQKDGEAWWVLKLAMPRSPSTAMGNEQTARDHIPNRAFTGGPRTKRR